MASYPTLSPTLTALAATETDPTGAEDAGKLNDAIVQTRVWLGDFLGQALSDTGKLLPYAIDGTVIPAGMIRGSNPVGDVQREILQRSIRAIDVTLASITTAEIALATIVAANIADGAITEAKLAAGAFSASKIGTAAITGDKIHSLAIETNHLKDGAVATAKIADEAVTAAKIAKRGATGVRLPTGTVGQILVGGNTVDGEGSCFEAKTLTGVINVDADGVTTFNSDNTDASAFAIVAESGRSSGSNGGKVATSGSGGWYLRGANVAEASGSGAWIIEKDPANLVNINGSKIEFKQNGSYRLVLSAPCYARAGHMLRATVKKDAIAADTEVFYGTSEFASLSNLVQTRSQMEIIVTFSGATDTLFPYITVDHWIDAGTGTNTDLGRATGPGVNERYAVVSVFKLL